MRIVYVEDNIANVHLVKRVARMGQHEIISYIDGLDAINNFEYDHPDLVLMDIQLAGELTGIEVVKKLRDKGYETPIIAVTAYAMVGDKDRCIEAGCTDYLSKPIPVAELVRLFQQYEESAEKTKSVTETPETSTESTATSEPVVTKKPDTKPNATAEPAVADKSEVTSEPIVTDKPVEPEATTEAVVANKAEATIVDENDIDDTQPATTRLTPNAEGQDKSSKDLVEASVPVVTDGDDKPAETK